MKQRPEPQNISSKRVGEREFERLLDPINRRLLEELIADGRLSFGELARRVGLTAPSVTERVRRLQEAGIITGFRADVDLAKGRPSGIVTFVTLQCKPNRCLRREGGRRLFPEVADGYRISGDRCSLLKVRTDSIDHLEIVLDRMAEFGQTSTTFVLNSRWDE